MTRATSLSAPRSRRAAVAPLPASIEPMLAVSSALPSDLQNWGFEYKWDGVRCMSYWDGRRLSMLSRNQIQISQRYPELANLGAAISKPGTVLDGEVVALDATGRPSFPLLQQRMHVDHPTPVLVRGTPVWYLIFDCLYFNGRSVMEEPYHRRRELLEHAIHPGANWQLSPYHVGEGDVMLEAAKKTGMEGVVAKLLNSPYAPGRRSPDWRKIKVVFGQELVIGGWQPEVGERYDRIGALLLGYYEPASGLPALNVAETATARRPGSRSAKSGAGSGKVLRYAGRVGSGFSDATHAKLVAALKRIASTENPFIDPLPRGIKLFVEPTLVAEVEYRRWPEGGMIQQASFKGLRTDKPARDVVRETRGAL